MANAQKRPRPAGLGQTAYKRELGFRHLGVKPQQVERIPFLHADLKGITSLLNRDRSDWEPLVRPLDLLQYSDDPEAKKVFRAYLLVPGSYRKLLPVEAFCLAAGVSPLRILEIIAGVAVRQGAQASAVIAAAQLPRVVQKTVDRALQDGGTQERMMLQKAVGFLPSR